MRRVGRGGLGGVQEAYAVILGSCFHFLPLSALTCGGYGGGGGGGGGGGLVSRFSIIFNFLLPE